MMLFKMFVYAAAGFGLLFLLAVCVGKVIAYGNRQPPRCEWWFNDRQCVLWPDHTGDCAVYPPRKGAV